MQSNALIDIEDFPRKYVTTINRSVAVNWDQERINNCRNASLVHRRGRGTTVLPWATEFKTWVCGMEQPLLDKISIVQAGGTVWTVPGSGPGKLTVSLNEVGYYLNGLLASINSQQEPSLPAKQITPAQRLLERLRTFASWNANWDAEGAPAPDKEASNKASLLIGFLSSYAEKITTAMDASGRPMLFLKSPRGEGEISFSDCNYLNVWCDINGATDLHEVDVTFDGTRLPIAVENAIEMLWADEAV